MGRFIIIGINIIAVTIAASCFLGIFMGCGSASDDDRVKGVNTEKDKNRRDDDKKGTPDEKPNTSPTPRYNEINLKPDMWIEWQRTNLPNTAPKECLRAILTKINSDGYAIFQFHPNPHCKTPSTTTYEWVLFELSTGTVIKTAEVADEFLFPKSPFPLRRWLYAEGTQTKWWSSSLIIQNKEVPVFRAANETSFYLNNPSSNLHGFAMKVTFKNEKNKETFIYEFYKTNMTESF